MSDPTPEPTVSVVIPMLNEIDFIGACLGGFADQSYGTEKLDVIVVDGGSTDGSREYVDRYAADHPWIRVLDNPRRRAASAFNVGVEAARGDVLVLFSAHGEPAPGFVQRSVSVLEETGAAGVGGRYLHEGTDPMSRAVGLAMVSPFGMASPHRWQSRRGEVDTISHPAYRTDVLRSVGPFDEALERNSDYELNYRMREAGHTLLFDPSVESTYRPRPSLVALSRQFWWYGRWKERVIRRHPRSLKVRHLAAPALVVCIAAVPPAVRSRAGRRAVLAGSLAYAGVTLAATLHARPWDRDASVLATLASFPIMHLAWGAGFITSLAEDTGVLIVDGTIGHHA